MLALAISCVKAHSHCAIFPDCDCDSSYRNKWIVQDLNGSVHTVQL